MSAPAAQANKIPRHPELALNQRSTISFEIKTCVKPATRNAAMSIGVTLSKVPAPNWIPRRASAPPPRVHATPPRISVTMIKKPVVRSILGERMITIVGGLVEGGKSEEKESHGHEDALRALRALRFWRAG
jgi:hypothetical protein